MKNVKNIVTDHVRPQVGNCVYYRVRNQVGDQVWNQVWDRVYDHLNKQQSPITETL